MINAVLITGETYPHRRELARLGGRWSRDMGGYLFTPDGYTSAGLEGLTALDGLHIQPVEVDPSEFAPPTYADKRAARSERHERNAARYEGRAEGRERKANEVAGQLAGDPMYSDYGIMTEPIKVGHHSEGRHRRAKERVSRKMGQAVQLGREAAELRGRASAALAAAKPDSERSAAFMMRRIEGLGAELRRIERTIAGHHTSGLGAVPADLSTEWGQRLAAKRDELAEGVAYWEALLDGCGGVLHSKATIKAGDTITGQWVGGRARVERTNAKTVSIILLDHPLIGWKGKVPYAEIVGVVAGGEA